MRVYLLCRVMCSVAGPPTLLTFTRNCTSLVYNSSTTDYSSRDLSASYTQVCPYYPSCGLLQNGTSCSGSDSSFTFSGRVGRVVEYRSTATPPTVLVTFNDGLTSYELLVSDVRLELSLSAYELWWVQRTPSEFIVQKRKGFNVTFPACTFDPLYNRYPLTQ